ncbi:hypothetical protein C8Q75DRAFT_807671 [Abortiporus biennis]|nr:hypothetical protein C8Q75DRAFT_807671 [Abortiporus biennis]
MAQTVTQTTTPISFATKPSKATLVQEFRGKHIHALRTPAVVIDKAVVASNCAKMHENAKQWGASFRAHVKTHKTSEGVRMQLVSSANTTHAIVVSTLMEAHEVVNAGLVEEGIVKDILYGLPIPVNKILDLSALWDTMLPFGGTVRILVDHPDQIKHIEEFELARPFTRKWSAFIKIDAGGKRAGLTPEASALKDLITRALGSPAVSVYGFYCHAGQSYASTSLEAASQFLSVEVDAVNRAAGVAFSILKNEPPTDPFVLSVGSTPTAHAATAGSKAKLASLLNGTLELHAGNYPLLDLQQLHTTLVDKPRIAQKVLATVISYYPGRGVGGSDEALCDAGAIAMSKDTGPSGTFGEVIGTSWKLGRLSQEHGILTRDPNIPPENLELGQIVHIIGQHACLILAAHPWYYIVDSDKDKDIVDDVWVPWKGW